MNENSRRRNTNAVGEGIRNKWARERANTVGEGWVSAGGRRRRRTIRIPDRAGRLRAKFVVNTRFTPGLHLIYTRTIHIPDLAGRLRAKYVVDDSVAGNGRVQPRARFTPDLHLIYT